MRPSLLLLLSFSALGCAKSRAPAADDLQGLTRFLVANFEDDEAMADGVSNFVGWMETVGRTEEPQEDGFLLTALTAEDLQGHTFPDRVPLQELVGVAVTHASPFSIDDHALSVTLEDQAWAAPRKYNFYTRSILAGDVDAFLAPGPQLTPQVIRTTSDVEQSRLGITIPYVLKKDYRWVSLPDDERALVGFAWIEEPGCSGDDGVSGNCIELTFTAEVFYESSPDETLRMWASWNNLSLIIELGQDLQIAQLAKGGRDALDAGDVFLETLVNGE